MSQEVVEQQTFKEELKNIIKAKSFEYWQGFFQKLDLCVEPVLTLGEACSHQQIHDRNMIVKVDGISQVASAINMSKSKANYLFKGCDIGANNDILMSEFSFSQEEFNQLNIKGVFGTIQQEKL